ncbi:hypothetical protein [Photobacterium galatheae]|uniref:Copper resistance protein n=1 Tax=Photobacterium galatheae TaxID=1654360 RepID=A0A066RSQ6_9GAMM|nr:hypothetical protein [Photobacterium galatheae]KDM93495.1 hypothetical protein EA58_01120 [Photobacterium galatheae]MCM0147077.1 hypothetical protein [Photobacterium galatheae]
MLYFFRRQPFVYWAFVLTAWVMFVCLTKNIGAVSLCPEQSVLHSQVKATETAEHEAPGADVGTCELSSKLIQMKFQLHDFVFLPAVFLILLIAGLFGASRISPPCFREPKVPKRRIHLQLCTFRE